MALNWAVLTPRGQPVPLPDEKLFLTMQNVSLSLQPMIDSSTPNKAVKPTIASGTTYITSQRVVFVSATATPQATSSGDPNELRTLSVPLSHWQDGRLNQPLFAAIYYEALIRPVAEGGLTAYQQAKITFREGRSWEFVEAVDEVKRRYDDQRGEARRAAAGEDLPTYTPRSGSSTSPSTPRPVEPSLLAAADTARRIEERELAPSPSAGGPPGYDEAIR